MDITITLTDDEVLGLKGEQQGGESLDSVLHRLISPLVERNVSEKFKILLVRFEAAPIAKKAQVIGLLEKMF